MKNKIIKQSSIIIDVPFFDVDAMNIVWHGNYVKYLEVARCELLRSFNYDYLDMHESGYLWPIVDLRVKYINSAKFTNKIKVIASLVEYESRMKIEYLITNEDETIKLTKAYTVQVAVDIATQEMQYISPPVLLEKLGINNND